MTNNQPDNLLARVRAAREAKEKLDSMADRSSDYPERMAYYDAAIAIDWPALVAALERGERAEADAARYRWLKENKMPPNIFNERSDEWPTGWDAYIDAQIEELEKERQS